jgi:hypothetical protein
MECSYKVHALLSPRGTQPVSSGLQLQLSPLARRFVRFSNYLSKWEIQLSALKALGPAHVRYRQHSSP